MRRCQRAFQDMHSLTKACCMACEFAKLLLGPVTQELHVVPQLWK